MLTLDDLTGAQILSLAVGWRPPRPEEHRSGDDWADWAAFMADYVLVRDEFLASPWADNPAHPGELPFAERIYQRFGPDGPGLLDAI
jgi:hypothetical protein